jgi:signal transduction histidine kinase
LLGNPKSMQGLGSVAPELSRRLYHWRTTRKVDNTSVALAEDVPEVIPRFTQLASHDDSNVLVFLDDTSLLSRRAEQLTLTSLGRLSASIAHEIRNPLAAISYSAQLLPSPKRCRKKTSAWSRDHQQPLQPCKRNHRTSCSCRDAGDLARSCSVSLGPAFRR